MKKLIGIISSFVSFFSVSATIISCGINKNQELAKKENDGNIPVIPDHNFVESKIDSDLFKAKLSDEGIDGSILNTNSTGADVLFLIKDVIIDNDPTATNIKFINPDEETNFLSKGNNYFTVSFFTSNKTLEFPVFVRNVQDANELDKNELEIYVNGILNDEDLLEVGYEDEDINTDDVTKWKKVIGQKIHEKAKVAAISIRTANTSKPGELNVTIEVDNLPYGIQKITKQKLYMSNKIDPITTLAVASNTFDDGVKVIHNLIFNNNSLTTHNKKKDALNAIEEEITDYFKNNKLPAPQFEYDFVEMSKQLVVGKNEIKIGIKNPKTNKVTNEIFILNDVKKEAEYHTYQNMIKERISKGIDASKFNEKDSYEHILPLLNAAAGEFNAYADIELKNKNQIKTLLKSGDNRIDVVVNLQGHQPVNFTALLKGVKPFVILEEVKNRYATERTFKQGNSAYTFKDAISAYQEKIRQNFPNAGIVISLKDSSKLNQNLFEGVTQIEVNYSQNGKTLSGVIKPSILIKSIVPVKSNQNDFAKIVPYVNKGITAVELKANLTTENNLYEALLALSKFIEALEPGVIAQNADSAKILNNKLKPGDNTINLEIYKKGMPLKKFTFTLKNVVAKSDHLLPTQQNKNPQDKKLWDVYDLIKTPDLPASMAGRTKGEIASVLQKVMETKISGVKILMGESIEVLKEKIVSKAKFLFKVYLKNLFIWFVFYEYML